MIIMRQIGCGGIIVHTTINTVVSVCSPLNVWGKGHAFIDRALYLPKVWTSDPAWLAAAHVPQDTAFVIKPRLAVDMVARAVAAFVPFAWAQLADQVGAICAAVMPLFRCITAHAFAAERLHGDDTTVPVLAGGKTDIGRAWVYVRDDGPFGGPAPPAAVFHYSRDRGGAHPQGHLATYAGILQADAFGGYNTGRPNLHPGTRRRVEHPGPHHDNDPQRRLEVRHLPVRAPLTVLHADFAPEQRVPGIVDDRIGPDMGRMTP